MKVLISLVCCFVLGSFVSVMKPFNGAESAKVNEDVSFGEHVELGDVHWHRNFDSAKSLAASTGKPMFLLFQEVPGCQTCQNFGSQPLSHPLLVEAIEDLFVPVAIFNNQPGADAEILKRFGEPAWNNPVVRFLNADTTDLIDRKDSVWSIDATVPRIAQALTAAGKPVPAFLNLIQASRSARTETAEFAMHCYWEGEAKLGGLDGVLTTRAGWRDGLEVVQLTYLPSKISYETLVKNAQSFECASKVFAHSDDQLAIARAAVGSDAVKASGEMRDAKASDQKYHLSHTLYRHLPLTQLQATRINALVKQRKPAADILSPRQQRMLKQIESVAKSDSNSLAGFSFPNDASQLAEYQERLVNHLTKSTSVR